MIEENKMETVLKKILELGAYKAAIIDVKDIPFSASFRDMCASNVCGNYGKNYMCPPDVGDIAELIEKARGFDKALVYQTVGMLEDSYDFEGMQAAGDRHNILARALKEEVKKLSLKEELHLGAGGCRLCGVCAKREGLPCRNPDEAMASLEAYGIAVSKLAELCKMRYINGQNTVTYFGAVLYKE